MKAFHGPYPSLAEACRFHPAILQQCSTVFAFTTYWPHQSANFGKLAVRTPGGWFLEELPDSNAPGGRQFSHHTPAGSLYEQVRFEKGTARGILQESRRSLLPGRGARGGGHSVRVLVRHCRLAHSEVSCDAPVEVYTKSCRTPQSGGPDSCQHTGVRP
jgi:hypothetical protein